MIRTQSDLCAQRPPNSQGVYLYCFMRPGVVDRIQAAGVDDRTEVASLTVGEVAAVFSPVSLDAFIGPSGNANLHDASWIVSLARRHEHVVEEVMQLSPVLPARFGTVLSSRSILGQLAAKNAGKIRQFLEEMVNREEWSVTAFLDVPKAEGWMLASQAAIDEIPGQDPVSPGVRYIQDKRRRAYARQRLEDWRHHTAGEVGRSLAAHAVDARSLPLQPREASGPGTTMLLNCALLVLKSQVVELCEHASLIEARYANRGLSLNVSGPWPPYSFCPPALNAESCE